MLDRIDIHVEVPLVDFKELTNENLTGESSAEIRARVSAARAIQVARYKSAKLTANAAMGAKQVRECCKLDAESRGYLEHAMEQMNFSARALADLAGKPAPTTTMPQISLQSGMSGCVKPVNSFYQKVGCMAARQGSRINQGE